MSFSTALFLFLFMPISLAGYWLADKKYKNLFLCAISILFYAWSGFAFLLLILVSTGIAYILGLRISKSTDTVRKTYLVVGIIYNVGVLFYFKYFEWLANVMIDCIQNFNPSFNLNIKAVSLPLGISFYTFSILSYLLDIYWEKSKAQNKVSNLLLYILLFPKVMTGPIMRYADFEHQLYDRPIDMSFISGGVERFIKGLVKKVLIADRVAPIVSYAFTDVSQINTLTAWLGIVGYLIQLYYDFSGYSDMAIGLGNMLGFRLPENFSHPYMSKTVAEFWRRWHSTLGEWLKDYIYMPVFRETMQKKNPFTQKKMSMHACDIIALLVTWILCGMWHGAGSKFLLYGLWYYTFIVIERIFEQRKKKLIKLKKIKKKEDSIGVIICKRVVTFFAILIGQTLFRSSSINEMLLYCKALFSFNFNGYEVTLIQLTTSISVTIIIGIIFCFPIYDFIKEKVQKCIVTKPAIAIVTSNIYNICLLIAYIVVLLYIAGSNYAPFLYEVF